MDFQVGEYICNPHYGVGLIREVGTGDKPDLAIDFHREKNLRVSARLIENSSRRLSPDGFLALWYEDPAQANKLLEEDPARAVALALADFVSTRAKTEELKDYFGPCIRESDWTKWWKKTQQAVKKAEYIDSSKSDEREYRLRQEPISLAEEAFRRFQRTRKLGDLKRAYEDTKAIFNALETGTSLSESHQEDLKRFYIEVSNDASFDVGTRLDALFRLEERKWLTREEAYSSQLALVQTAKLYRVEAYAENRLLDFLFANIGNAALHATLLTGLGASSASLERVFEWLTKHGDPEQILSGLRVALKENLPPELRPSDHRVLATRLDRAAELVELLVMSPDISQECVMLFENLQDRIGGYKQIQTDTKLLIVSVVRLGGVLFDRVVFVQPELGTRVVASLFAPSFSSDFIITVLDARDKAQISDTFNSQLEKYALEHARSTNNSALAVLLSGSSDDRVTAVARLTEIARQYGTQNQYLLNQIADQVQVLCRDANNTESVKMIPDLDLLVHLGESAPWKHLLGEQRRRAYFVAMQEYMPTASSPDVGHIGVLDRSLALAFRDYMHGELVEMRSQVADYRKRQADQEQHIKELIARLEETQRRMEELRQSHVQIPQQTRFEERLRVLREFAASVAEFERFNAKPERKSPEIDALLRRMNSLLAAQGVFPRETLGNVIEFDSAYCQIVGEAPGQIIQNDKVEVIERGYTIKDTQGTPRLLKPVLVRFVTQK